MGITLPKSGSVYLDASIFIYSVEKIDPYWQVLHPAWAEGRKEGVSFISSELSLLETQVGPLRSGDDYLVHAFRDLLLASEEVHLIAINQPVLNRSARLRAQLGLKTPDAIHAATAQLSKCELLLTNDEHFRVCLKFRLSY